MIDVLKEMDNYLPGTYHEGAEILNFTVRTNHLVHYKKIKEFTDAFFELIDNYKTLFFKGLNTELSDEEIKEYNFLVTVLGIKDKYFQVLNTAGLYYTEFQIGKEVYRTIGSDDIFDYVKVDLRQMPEFWRCAELTDYKDTFQRIIDLNPQIKIELKKLAILVDSFCCDFIWSDTDLQGCSLDMLVSRADPLEETDEFFTRIYVKKTPDELRDDYMYADSLLKLSGPEKLGGLSIKTRDDDKELNIARERTNKLCDAKRKFLEALHDEH